MLVLHAVGGLPAARETQTASSVQSGSDSCSLSLRVLLQENVRALSSRGRASCLRENRLPGLFEAFWTLTAATASGNELRVYLGRVLHRFGLFI